MAEDFNTLGLAYLYLGNYGAALSNYQRALELDRKYGSAEGEITSQNNIGNVCYFQGRYTEALRSYQAAMEKVNFTSSEEWNPRLLRRLDRLSEAADIARTADDHHASRRVWSKNVPSRDPGLGHQVGYNLSARGGGCRQRGHNPNCCSVQLHQDPHF
jgi:tetratricopeptide (TPR) repeat protein